MRSSVSSVFDEKSDPPKKSDEEQFKNCVQKYMNCISVEQPELYQLLFSLEKAEVITIGPYKWPQSTNGVRLAGLQINEKQSNTRLCEIRPENKQGKELFVWMGTLKTELGSKSLEEVVRYFKSQFEPHNKSRYGYQKNKGNPGALRKLQEICKAIDDGREYKPLRLLSFSEIKGRFALILN